MQSRAERANMPPSHLVWWQLSAAASLIIAAGGPPPRRQAGTDNPIQALQPAAAVLLGQRLLLFDMKAPQPSACPEYFFFFRSLFFVSLFSSRE